MHLSPNVALLLTAGFVLWLFRRDVREKPNVTGALWIPVLWLFLMMSRLPSQWLVTLGVPLPIRSMEEGNPIDALTYFSLIIAGLVVLNRRQLNWQAVVRDNVWLFLFLVFCFLAIAWSDFPFVAFKRWIKILGSPIMVLIVLTEPNPEESLTRLMKRTAYVIVPVSILFIKYFEDLGRGFDEWTGEGFNLGITLDKNALGYDCLILGYFFWWHFIKTWRLSRGPQRRNELLLGAAFLYMIWWLLNMAHSSTSLVSLLLAIVVLMLLGLPFLNHRRIGVYAVVAVAAAAVCELAFGISSGVIQLLGKDPTLTGRTVLWGELFDFHTNPLLGAGFESFWLGDRLQTLWDNHWWHPNEAHNGYIETYLNLGLIGLFLLLTMFITTFIKARRELLTNFEFGRFRLGFLAAVVVYNWTEAAFKGLHPVWFVFYLVALQNPRAEFAPAQSTADAGHSPADGKFAYAGAAVRR